MKKTKTEKQPSPAVQPTMPMEYYKMAASCWELQSLVAIVTSIDELVTAALMEFPLGEELKRLEPDTVHAMLRGAGFMLGDVKDRLKKQAEKEMENVKAFHS